MNIWRRLLTLAGVCIALNLAGCATVPGGESVRSPVDPFESYNRAMHEVNQKIDDVALAPAARAYRDYVPQAIRVAVRNFFDNLWDASTAVNQLLQGKPMLAGSDLLRFGINSTFGFAGIADVASELGLERHREDFGQTMGRWGIPAGPYLVLPIFGPSSVRDGLGLFVDFKTDLVSRVTEVRSTRYALRAAFIVDTRERFLDATRLIEGIALDRYLFVRDLQLQRRRNLVWDGNPPLEDVDEGEQPGQGGSR